MVKYDYDDRDSTPSPTPTTKTTVYSDEIDDDEEDTTMEDCSRRVYELFKDSDIPIIKINAFGKIKKDGSSSLRKIIKNYKGKDINTTFNLKNLVKDYELRCQRAKLNSFVNKIFKDSLYIKCIKCNNQLYCDLHGQPIHYYTSKQISCQTNQCHITTLVCRSCKYNNKFENNVYKERFKKYNITNKEILTNLFDILCNSDSQEILRLKLQKYCLTNDNLTYNTTFFTYICRAIGGSLFEHVSEKIIDYNLKDNIGKYRAFLLYGTDSVKGARQYLLCEAVNSKIHVYSTQYPAILENYDKFSHFDICNKTWMNKFIIKLYEIWKIKITEVNTSSVFSIVQGNSRLFASSLFSWYLYFDSIESCISNICQE